MSRTRQSPRSGDLSREHQDSSPDTPDPTTVSHRWIIHVDMDAFYASVEQRDQPAYKDKPVIIGADPQYGKGRGVVSTASYEARKFGIHSAMPISQAYKLCPHGLFLPVRMSHYQEISTRIFSIFHGYSDLVEPISLDEAFLDVTGSIRLFGTAETIGKQIQRDIWEEEQLSASVGIATTKFVAKVASDLRKPKGFVVVAPGTEVTFLQDLPVERLWGAGPKTTKKFRAYGYCTIGDIAKLSSDTLMSLLGQHGLHLWELSKGRDPREVIPEESAKSIGAETTFETDTADSRAIRQTLLKLSERIGHRLRAEGVMAGKLTLKFRDSSFQTITRSVSIQQPIDQDSTLYQTALTLLERVPFSGQKVRLLGLSGFKLISHSCATQLSLFDSPNRSTEQLSQAVDTIRARFGSRSIQHATLLTKKKT